MLTTGTTAIFHSGFCREVREIIVIIVRALGSDYSDEAAFRVRAEDGDPAIRDLVARGYLRIAQAAPVRQTAGRPASTLYDVRPHD